MSETKHVALPLKYRPMTFDDVVGQEHVVKTLRHAIEANRIANAYLFIGPRGIGKTTLSRIFAKALNCSHDGASGAKVKVRGEGEQRNASNSTVQPPTSNLQPYPVEPCGKCSNCEEIAAGRSLDVTELDAASHNKVEDVKPIIDAVQFKPTASKYKIFIIDECHMLSNAAWNALLKTLEEPPEYVRFIFATTEGDKVLATIVSRCQRFDLRRISTKDIVSRLKHVCECEKIEAEEDALLAIARGAEGGMRDALSSLDQLISFKGDKVTEEDALGVFGLVSRSALENLAGAILKGDDATILSSIEMFDSAGKNMRRLAAELLQHFRNLVVLQALGPKSPSLEATPDQIKVLEQQAAGIDPGRIFRVCDQIAELEDKLRYVLSVRTLIEMNLLRASKIATTATIEELMKAVRALKSADVANVEVPAAKVQEFKGSSVQEATAPMPKKVAPPSLDTLPPLPEELAPAPKSEEKPQPTKTLNRQDILNDPKLNAILASLPGALITDIKEK